MKGRKRKQKKKAKVVTGVPVPRSEFDLMARPFSLFADLQERMNQFFKLPFVFSPRVDVFQEGKTLIVKAEIPGIKKDEISVSISDDSVTLKGERKQAREQKGKGFYRSECAYGSFQRSVALPHRVKAKEAQAKYENGILEVRVPKAKGEGTKTIDLKVE